MLTIDQFFDDSGPLASVLPSYRRRDEQVRLAKAVEGTLRGGGALLGDGPTGTGKSMAYLAPLALGGGQAVVSTATKALQHQLVAKDLPTLAAACEAAGIKVPSFALLKGRGEFLCDRRMDEYLEEAGMAPEPDLVQIDLWRQDTQTGDKESLPIMPPRYWSEIAADSDDCVRKGCDYEHSCFYFSQKEAAQGADILVVNHALLLANLAAGGAVFSMADKHLVIDEAHRLEDYVCEAFGARVSRHRLRYVLSSVRRKAHDLDDYLETCGHAADEFFRELWNSRSLGSLMTAPPSYALLVDELTAIRNLVENNPQAAVNKLTGMVEKLLADLRSFYEPLLGTHAYAVLDPRGRGYPTLQSWLVEPREVVPEHILEREEDAATIMTSATLATGSRARSFDYQRRRLGFDVTNGLRVREHLGDEMFDYANNALVYLEEELPPPVPSRVDEFLEGAVGRAAELVSLSEGRALILLATWKAVQRFKEEFPELVPYPVRFQGEASTSSLIKWLRDTPNAVLVGTRSLWEGVDVAGEALSLVVVDKVPFPPPTDPVIEKLCQKAGSAWFPEVSLPKAMLTIRQGLGRLIRRQEDRGIMAILDSRITTSTWGPAMRKAIPRGTPTTSDVEDVEEFFSRFPGVGPRAA